MIREGSVHEFKEELLVNGSAVRAVGVAKGPPFVLCVWGGPGGDGGLTFDARALAGRRVLVRDPKLVPVVVSLFASFNPPIRPPIIVGSGDHEARAARVSPGGALAGRDARVADFSSVSREIFRVVHPEFLFESLTASTILYSEEALSGSRVTCVALETVFWTTPGADSEAVAKIVRERCDLRRMRELEVRFGARLHDHSEQVARSVDSRFLRMEGLMLEGGRAYVETPGKAAVLVPPPGELQDPRDYARGTMRVSDREMESVSRSQGVDVEPGAAFMFRIGSYPERAWYVHEVFDGGVVLAPWMPVRLGRRADHIGLEVGGRSVRAVVGDVERVHSSSPDLVPGASVGDAEKGVFGELYKTKGGSWAVIGERPDGFPAIDPGVRRAARQSRMGSGERFDYACHNGGGEATREACEAAGGVWDRPCTRDHECPFFSKDARGGCIDGYCEMPLGVDNLAFTIPSGEPVCENCGPGSPDPVRCCDYLREPRYAWGTRR